MPLDEGSTEAALRLILMFLGVGVVPLACNLIGRRIWDDWLDQRLGRGSIKDEFPRRHW